MNSTIYKIRKNCALYQVVCGNIVVYSSMRKKNCEDFVRDNTPKDSSIDSFNYLGN